MSRGLPMTYTGENTCDKKVIESLISVSTFVKQLRKEIFVRIFSQRCKRILLTNVSLIRTAITEESSYSHTLLVFSNSRREKREATKGRPSYSLRQESLL